MAYQLHALALLIDESPKLSGSHNGMLSLAADRGELRLQALMGTFAFGRVPAGVDVKSLIRDQAAEYLWHRFAGRLER